MKWLGQSRNDAQLWMYLVVKKDGCCSWSSNTLTTWCKELTYWKRPWCWERLRAGGEGDNRGWDGWMASPTQWTWVWVNSGSWWWTGRPGMLRFMGSQRVRHDWATELNWTEWLRWKQSMWFLSLLVCKLRSFPGWNLKLALLHGGQEETKERGKFNKRGAYRGES